MKIIDTLTRAREIFRERGGAKGIYYNRDGRVCALGALNLALGHHPSYPILALGSSHFYPILVLLDQAAKATTTMPDAAPTIASVNDVLGPAAVLDVYDYAIKELENGV